MKNDAIIRKGKSRYLAAFLCREEFVMVRLVIVMVAGGVESLEDDARNVRRLVDAMIHSLSTKRYNGFTVKCQSETRILRLQLVYRTFRSRISARQGLKACCSLVSNQSFHFFEKPEILVVPSWTQANAILSLEYPSSDVRHYTSLPRAQWKIH